MRSKFLIGALALAALAALFMACPNPINPEVPGPGPSPSVTPVVYTYTVTFDSQGATTAATPAQLEVRSPATTLSALPQAPAKTGHNFGGWFTQANGAGEAFSAATPVTGNLTVYAHWVKLPDEITLNGAYGKVVVSGMSNHALTISYTPAAPIDSAKLFATPGNDLAGRSLNDGVMVKNGDTWSLSFSHASFKNGVKIGFAIVSLKQGAETIVPQGSLGNSSGWAQVSYTMNYAYTVSFDGQGATQAAAPNTLVVSNPATTVGSLPAPPVREGFSFGGWFTAPKGAGQPFAANTPVEGDLTVYAKWTSNTRYTVSFDSQGADTAATPAAIELPAGEALGQLPSYPSKDGYLFCGWWTQVNGGGSAFDGGTVVNGNLNVYAWWKPRGLDLGTNVLLFDPDMPAGLIQSQLDAVFHSQQASEFSAQRYALLFRPGQYHAAVNVGFYMQVLGLGQSPDDVHITGSIQSDGAWEPSGNHHVTQNFWRSVENIAVTPIENGRNMWAVSQAAPARRIHVKGDLWLFDLNPNTWASGWASGGFLADSLVDGTIYPGGQQQWLYRNSNWGSATGGVWNMVFLGCNNAPATSFGAIPNYTTTAQTPTVREKPYLYLDAGGEYRVFVPALRANSQGPSWSAGVASAGSSLPISQFHIAKAGVDSAASLNAALAAGKHLLLTPGTYHLNQALQVSQANTVVLGLGLATLVADSGNAAITVADVDGVMLGGLLIEAGATNSSCLVQVGPPGSGGSHASNPVHLQDLFFRVGGAQAGKASLCLEINSDNVIGDNLWIWRADHGINTSTWGWNTNPSDTGLVVNGDNVFIYGLAVEHFQKYQTVWNGEGGRVYFYQSEIPYDVPDQASWMNGTNKGYASYKVADGVATHSAWGVGVYCFFNVNPSVELENAIEVPASGLDGAMFHNMVTVALGTAHAVGQINHVINGQGATVIDAANPTYLVK